MVWPNLPITAGKGAAMNKGPAISHGPLERHWVDTETGLRSIWVERPGANPSGNVPVQAASAARLEAA
jgi:hypothetical protein